MQGRYGLMVLMAMSTLPAGAQTFLPSAAPAPAGIVRIATYPGPNGRRFVYEITDARAQQQPHWDQAASPGPPLSMAEAIDRAKAWLTANGTDATKIQFTSVGFVRVPPTSNDSCVLVSCWSFVYVISFVPTEGGRALPDGSRVLVLLDGSIVEPHLEETRAEADGAYRLDPGNGVVAPRPTQTQKPSYTPAAMAARIQGNVRLEGIVWTDGTVRDPKVVRSLDQDLDQEAIKAFVKWRFAPGTYQGKPVPVRVTMDMSFTIGAEPRQR